MHADQADIRSSIRRYVTVFVLLLIFTIVTVTASRFHVAVPAAIAVALVIAAVNGSMVAGVFMHLSHERRAIYGALLLTAIVVVALLLLPVFTTLDHIGTPIGR